MMTLMCDIGDMRASACICVCASVPIINEEQRSFKREVFSLMLTRILLNRILQYKRGLGAFP